MTTEGTAQDTNPSIRSMKEVRALLAEAETLLRAAPVGFLDANWFARRDAFLAKLKSQTPLPQEDE